MVYSINPDLRGSERYKKFVELSGYGEPFMFGVLIRVWERFLERSVDGVFSPFSGEELFKDIGWVRGDTSRVQEALVESGYLTKNQWGKLEFNFAAFEEYFRVTWAVRYYEDWRKLPDAEFERQFKETRVEIYDPDSDIKYKGMISIVLGSRESALRYKSELYDSMIRKRNADKRKAKTDEDKAREKAEAKLGYVMDMPTLDFDLADDDGE